VVLNLIYRSKVMETAYRPEKELEHVVVGGSTVEAIGGVAAVVLTIIGLATIEPRFMVSISTIALGVALLFEGGLVAAEYSKVINQSGKGTLAAAEFGGGLSAQAMAGVAGIVLGILALLNLEPTILLGSAAIVLGAGIVLSSGVATQLNSVKIELSEGHEVARRAAQEAVSATAGLQVLSGIAAAVLGILALIGLAPIILTLVAMLVIGSSVLLSSTAVSGRMLSMFAG
jgi:hypothetical protein